MEVFVKESLHVLDYQNNVVDTIFLSDDRRTPGYAYSINITEANTGYSNLDFSIPNWIIDNEGNKVKNPKLALLTPLVKLRYHRQIFYTGDSEIIVREPMGYGDKIEYTDVTYSNQYPNNIIEDYVMDYIVQPVDKKRSGLEISTKFTAIDYPRFNLSKKRVGLTIAQDTITKEEWSLYENKPLSVKGSIQYVEWTTEHNKLAGMENVPTSWNPKTAEDYPLTKEQVYDLCYKVGDWPYGQIATAYYWRIDDTARFEGQMYTKGGFLVLHLYDFYSLTDAGLDPDRRVGEYGYDWTQLYEMEKYLCPNNAANYLAHILEGTNWTIKQRKNPTTGLMEPDVDLEEIDVAMPGQAQHTTEKAIHTCNINVSNSNCYNAITAVCQGLQLYPVFDCEKREVSLKLFAGKNYGLVYRLGSNLSSDSVKTNGEKVITKLYVSGGKDYNGDANINIGDAERSFIQTVLGVYNSVEDLPIPAEKDEYTGLYAVVKGNKEIEPAEPNTLYRYNGQAWEEITKEIDGVFGPGTLNLDAKTGLPAPWDPNHPEYIIKRSPYGTNYILNFKWMYDNHWMTQDQILGLYELNQQINDENKAFIAPYNEDRRKTLQEYYDTVNEYDLAQGEYQSVLNSMMNKYYKEYGKYSAGTVYAFHKAPLGLHEKNGKHYLWIRHCYNCGCTDSVAGDAKPTTAPVDCTCKTPRLQVDELYIPVYNDFGDTIIPPSDPDYPYGDNYRDVAYEPHIKGDYLKLVTTLDKYVDDNPTDYREDTYDIAYYEKQISIVEEIPLDENKTVDGYDYLIDGVYVRASSSNIEEWNEDIKGTKSFVYHYGRMLDYLEKVNACLKKIEDLEAHYNVWKEKTDALHAEIQDKYGDYIIEGNYTNNEQPYVGLLFHEGKEASDKYGIPEITYTLDVVDSSGLVEYRYPMATEYYCPDCQYSTEHHIATCPKCGHDNIEAVKDVYNSLVHQLHSVGQILPKAGDYVTIYDEPMGMFGVPGLITEISRKLDDPVSNKIKLDTAYTDDEELVGNIITATNTVLNNADIYARTAVLKTDGTIDTDSISQTLDNPNANITIVGTNGDMLLTGSYLKFTDPNDEGNAMKYSAAGIYATTNHVPGEEGTEWIKLMTPSGINANYINAGTIDTKKINIISGLSSKVLLDEYGLAIKYKANNATHLTTFDAETAKSNASYAKEWGEKNNLSTFVGIDKNKNALMYTRGFLVAEEGSNIANWITSDKGFYHLNGSTPDLWLSPSGEKPLSTDGGKATVNGVTENFTIFANNNFGVTKSGILHATGAHISGKITITDASSNLNKGTIAGFTAGSTGLTQGRIVLSPNGGAIKAAVNTVYTCQTNDKHTFNNYFDLKIVDGKLQCPTCGGAVVGSGGSGERSDWAIFANGNFGVTTSGHLYAANADISGTIKATSGEFKNATIDNCTMTNCRISAGQITTGTLDPVRIPNISADKITSGTIDTDRLDVDDIFAQDIEASGTISGAKLTGATILGGTLDIGNDPDVGEGNFSVATDGSVKAKKLTIMGDGALNKGAMTWEKGQWFFVDDASCMWGGTGKQCFKFDTPWSTDTYWASFINGIFWGVTKGSDPPSGFTDVSK